MGAVVDKVREYSWVFVALPVAEFLFALILGSFSCGTPLVVWLRFDSVVALGFVALIYSTGRTLTPVYQKLRQDPVGAAQRWQATDDWEQKFERLVPGIRFDTYRMGGLSAAGCVVLLLVGALWAAIGLFELLGTFIFGCSGATVVVFLLFVTLRVGIVVALLGALYHLQSEGAFDSCTGRSDLVSQGGSMNTLLPT